MYKEIDFPSPAFSLFRGNCSPCLMDYLAVLACRLLQGPSWRTSEWTSRGKEYLQKERFVTLRAIFFTIKILMDYLAVLACRLPPRTLQESF